MSTDLLSIHSIPRGYEDPRLQSDLAFAARPLFRRLANDLRSVGLLLDGCETMRERATRHARKWGVPKLFFAERKAQSEWEAKRAAPATFPEPFVDLLSASFPKLAAAWDRLPDLLDDALTLTGESLDVRRMARAVPGLRAAAARVPQAAELAGILGMPEEEVWCVIHPAARLGLRFVLEGVADVAQLRILLASRGPLKGHGYQYYRPEALRPNGTLPQGFAGSGSWYWGREKLDAVPQQHGERILLLGDPVMLTTDELSRRFTRISPEIRLLEVLKMGEVETWLRARCPLYRPSIVQIGRAA